jgi:DNA-binding CsgD family transcriptional regulator
MRSEFATAIPNAWGLTRRELQVLGLLAIGLRDKEIAGELGLSYRTVSKHLEAVYRKLGVSSRSAAVARALHAASSSRG